MVNAALVLCAARVLLGIHTCTEEVDLWMTLRERLYIALYSGPERYICLYSYIRLYSGISTVATVAVQPYMPVQLYSAAEHCIYEEYRCTALLSTVYTRNTAVQRYIQLYPLYSTVQYCCTATVQRSCAQLPRADIAVLGGYPHVPHRF